MLSLILLHHVHNLSRSYIPSLYPPPFLSTDVLHPQALCNKSELACCCDFTIASIPNKKMACHNSFDVELLYITKTPNRRCLSSKTPEVTTKTPVVTTKTPLGNN